MKPKPGFDTLAVLNELGLSSAEGERDNLILRDDIFRINKQVDRRLQPSIEAL